MSISPALGEHEPAFPGPLPKGERGDIVPAPPLPIEGSVDLAMPVERLWDAFMDVERWPSWNSCIWRARVKDGELRRGATLVWVFNAIKPWYPYKMPARARIVEFERHDRVTWEVNLAGFHAVHSYRFAELAPERSRFGSWEVAEGAGFRATRRFWLAHFRYVCRESLAGAAKLAAAPPT
jgi:hypothetical protein